MPSSVEVGPPGYSPTPGQILSQLHMENSFDNEHVLVPISIFPDVFSMEG